MVICSVNFIFEEYVMLFKDHWYLLFLLRVSFVQNIESPCQYDTKNQVVVVALLSMHDETTDCSRVTLRGLQQTAILQKTVLDINNKDALNEGMSLVLHVVDTCSSGDDVVNAALKSLVLSHQTCRNPPLMLGFLGPESYQQFQIMHQITSEFRKFHVLPFSPHVRRAKEENSVLYVGNNRYELRGKISLAILNQLKWRSIYVIVGDNVAVTGVLDYLLSDLDHVCVTAISKIPEDISTTTTFFLTILTEFQESGSDGIVIFAEDPGHIRPLLTVMNENPPQNNAALPVVVYINRIGLNSWELPRNYTILLLQETSETKTEPDLKLYDRSLWLTYRQQNELDYRRNMFDDLLDSTAAPFEYGLQLLWNAAKYARKIKCNLGVPSILSKGVCYDMLHANPLEWKHYMYKSSYYEQTTLRKISFEMNAPVSVKLYYVDAIINFPQLIGRVTEIGIVDLSMNLRLTIPKSMATSGPKKCLMGSTPKKSNIDFTVSIDHETNWLAVVVKKMKNLIQLEGIVSPETNEKLNAALCWLIGFFFFVCGLILITKCVYHVFRVQTRDEEEEARRRKRGRKSRIVST